MGWAALEPALRRDKVCDLVVGRRASSEKQAVEGWTNESREGVDGRRI